LTMLYRSTDRLSRRGAPVKNLAHSASFDSCDNDAPSKCGIKHLDDRFHETGFYGTGDLLADSSFAID
jgi:hypothetical protein